MTDTNTVPFQIRMPSDLHRSLKIVSYVSRHSMNDLAVKALTNFLDTEREAIRAIINQAQEDYGPVLDKLKDM
jgi:hypothetical protein